MSRHRFLESTVLDAILVGSHATASMGLDAHFRGSMTIDLKGSTTRYRARCEQCRTLK